MTSYLDSSALIKLYVKERHSESLANYVRRSSCPVSFSQLHELEIKNGLRLKAFRREAGRAAVKASIHLIDEDLASGVLRRPILDWADVFDEASRLSERFSTLLGSRSLDLLHVASAGLLGVKEFVTFDSRQATLVEKAGLKLANIPSRGGRYV